MRKKTFQILSLLNQDTPRVEKLRAKKNHSTPQLATKLPSAAKSLAPRISIVTPSFNQSDFLERTILSVLNQNYPNLEYIIIDGGSTDGSVEIIKKYERFLSYWVSEKDEGQTHAIEKGFHQSTGAILAYLNSDDTYLPGALRDVAEFFRENPKTDLVYRDAYFTDAFDNIIGEYKFAQPGLTRFFYDGISFAQPAMFWKRTIYEKIGGIQKKYNFCMDFDLFVRVMRAGNVAFFRGKCATYRIHKDAKSFKLRKVCWQERDEILRRYVHPRASKVYMFARAMMFRAERIFAYLLQGDFFYVMHRFRDKLEDTAFWDSTIRFLFGRSQFNPEAGPLHKFSIERANPKILFITGRADIGGGPEHISILMAGVREAMTVFIACPDDEPYASQWRARFGDERMFALPHRQMSLYVFFRLNSWIRSNGIQIMHSHGTAAGLYGRLLKFLNPKVKCVHTYHGIHYQGHSKTSGIFYLETERILQRLTDAIVHVSAGEEREANRVGLSNNKRKTRVVLNGVEDPSPLNIQALNKTSLSVSVNARIVFSACRFVHQKNLSLQLAIAKEMQSLAPDVVFLLAGDGEERASLEHSASIGNITNIRFLGFRNDIPALMRASDIFLSTSLWEGLPLVLLEYLSLGKPICATDVVGNQDVITHGKEGVLFAPDQPPLEIAQQILSLLNDPSRLRELGNNARDKYLALFTSGDMVKKTISIYQDLLMPRSRIS